MVATPLATVITTSAVTSMHVHRVRRQAHPATGRREPAATPWPEVLGALALPVTLVLLAVITPIALLVAPVLWAVLLVVAYRGAAASSAFTPTFAIVGIGSIALAIEALVAAFALGRSAVAYLALSVLVGLAASVAGYRRFFAKR